MDFKCVISYLNKRNIRYNLDKSLKDITSIQVGGVAKIVAYPERILDFCYLITYLYQNQIKFYILGNGTNVVFSDEAFDGVILCTNLLSNIKFDNDFAYFSCGASINSCCKNAFNQCLSGIEKLYGIPGTVGGAVYINASAFGVSVSDVISESIVYDFEHRKIYYLSKKEHCFNDKFSFFIVNRNTVILQSTFKLSKSEYNSIKNDMQKSISYRVKTQPYGMPSAGSVFKRPKGIIPSKLIDESGLKGTSIGGAQISNKHAGFIVNNKNASYDDIKKLTNYIKNTINELYNISLEEEIIFIE